MTQLHPTVPLPANDVQASRPAVHLSLTRAGVTGLQQVIRLPRGRGAEVVYYADIECSVDLEPSQKGVHMSRFPELFAEAIEQVVLGEALVIEELAGHIAREILERQGAVRSHVRIDARFPVARTTPVTGLPTQEISTLMGLAGACSRTGTVRRAVGVRVRGLNACPCAQGMVRERAAERLGGLGYEGDELERILDAVPIATHNQRGEATLVVGSDGYVDAKELLQIAEESMSAPIRALLKRPDELAVVEQAHAHPRFVEDSVRHLVAGLIERHPELGDDTFVLARQVNFETIHNHDVIAERSGLLGGLRREVLEGATDARHVALEAWLAS
jgi:GTP cyclohydrolase I/GTP cyclohydrolase-4